MAGLTGDLVLGIFDVLADRQQGKEFVAAWDAAKGGNSQRAPNRSAEAVRVFGGDALDFDIAANGAVSGEQVAKRRSAATKTLGATGTTQGDATANAREIVKQSASTGATAIRGIASWANHPNSYSTWAITQSG